jgi:dUTP pyrophosphatase
MNHDDQTDPTYTKVMHIFVSPKLRYAKIGDVKSPERGTEFSAGIDFFIPNDFNDGKNYTIQPQEKIIIPMQIHIDMLGSELEAYMMKFENKSGVAIKKGLVVGACVIDADYQGELMVHVYNMSNEPTYISPGDKIIQGILTEVLYAEPQELDFNDLYKVKSERGDGKFGSTGS